MTVILLDKPQTPASFSAGGGNGSFIIMEYVEFGGGRSDMGELGRCMARMHQATPVVSLLTIRAKPACTAGLCHRSLHACISTHR